MYKRVQKGTEGKKSAEYHLSLSIMIHFNSL